MLTDRLRRACRAAGWHLLGSVLVAALAAALVFGIWFPYPYRDLVGGRELFWLVVGVDVVCGPLLTLVMFNHLKSRRELTLDLTLVALIQMAALVYGLHTVVQARPVYLAFEVDRFRAVTVADIQQDQLRPEKGGLHDVGWGAPKVIGIRAPKDNEEMMRSLDLSLGGIEQAVRPDWWVPYVEVKDRVLQKARPLKELQDKRPDERALLDVAVANAGAAAGGLVWLPVTSFQSTGWVALIDATTAEIRSFAPVDGF
jgi:hypothetical protein